MNRIAEEVCTKFFDWDFMNRLKAHKINDYRNKNQLTKLREELVRLDAQARKGAGQSI